MTIPEDQTSQLDVYCAPCIRSGDMYSCMVSGLGFTAQGLRFGPCIRSGDMHSCWVQGLGFRVQGLGLVSAPETRTAVGFRVWGLGLRVWAMYPLRRHVQLQDLALGFRVQVLGFRVQVLGFRVQGLGFRSCIRSTGYCRDQVCAQAVGFRQQGLGFRV